MIKFTNNELNKAKAYAYHYSDQHLSSQYYLNKCKEDDDVILMRANQLLFLRKYKEVVDLLEPLVLKNNFKAVTLFLTVCVKNLNNFNRAYKLMEELIKNNKCFGYYGLLQLTLEPSDQVYIIPTDEEYIDYINKALECATFEERKLLVLNFSYLLDVRSLKNKEIKNLCYKFKIESINYFQKNDSNKLYLLSKIEREDEFIYINNEKEIKNLIFKDFDGVSALILGLYLIKNSRSKKTKFDSEAFLLFKLGHKFNNKLCSILYALSLGHEGIKDKEELNKATSILSNCRDIYSINIDYIPNSLRDTFNHLIEEFNIVLTPYLKNLYKIHPFFTGEN